MSPTNLKKSNKTSKMQNKTFSKVSGNKKTSSKPVKKPAAPKMPGEWHTGYGRFRGHAWR